MLSPLQKIISTDNGTVPFSCFKTRAMPLCSPLLQKPLLLLLQHLHQLRPAEESRQNSCLCTDLHMLQSLFFPHTIHVKRREFIWQKRCLFLPFVSLFHFDGDVELPWSIYQTALLEIPCLLTTFKKNQKHCSERYNKDSNVRFLKLAFLLDAEFRLSNFPARQMVTVN